MQTKPVGIKKLNSESTDSSEIRYIEAKKPNNIGMLPEISRIVLFVIFWISSRIVDGVEAEP